MQGALTILGAQRGKSWGLWREDILVSQPRQLGGGRLCYREEGLREPQLESSSRVWWQEAGPEELAKKQEIGK